MFLWNFFTSQLKKISFKYLILGESHSSGKTATQYEEIYKKSLENPEEFWGDLASKLIHWNKPWDKVLDDRSQPFTKWYVNGQLNASYNCIDRHIAAGRGEKVALIHDSPLTRVIRRVTYQELHDSVSYILVRIPCN